MSGRAEACRDGRFDLAGEAAAPCLLAAPLSFWGGVDPVSGRILDRAQPAFGEALGGRILVMPQGRGSSSSSSVLAETIRRGTGPAAIVMERPDPIVTIGAMVAQALYGIACPVVICPGSTDFAAAGGTRRLTITRTGDRRARLTWS